MSITISNFVLFRRIFPVGISLLAISLFLISAGNEPAPMQEENERPLVGVPTEVLAEDSSSNQNGTIPDVEEPAAVDPDTVLDQYMSACEARIDVAELDRNGNVKKQKRRRYTKADQRLMRQYIGIIAREMGANPKLLWIWASRESSYRPYKRHRLSPDREAAYSAWQRFRHTDYKEAGYRRTMKRSSAKDGTKDFWVAKAALSRILVYKDNPTYEARWRWSTGYGLYGMQPIYHVKRWDPNAPPEILCDEVVATVTAIWAARQIRDTCVSQGYPGTYETVNRGYSSGHCEPRPSWAKYFRKRAEREHLDVKQPARLGNRWPSETTDRAKILEHMRAKITEHNQRVAQRVKKGRLARAKSSDVQG